jgi:hypothetical protein
MSIFDNIDSWLINKPYQGLVDWSQKKPEWWMEQCAFILIVASGISHALNPAGFTGWAIFTFMLDMVVAAVFFWYSKMPAAIRAGAMNQGLRLFMLSLSILGIVQAFKYPLVKMICDFFYELAFCSVYYFAACEPPTPRKKTEDRLAYNL